MKQHLLKVLFFVCLTSIVYGLATGIYNPYKYDNALQLKVYFILSIVGSIIIPFLMYRLTNKRNWLISCVLLLITVGSIALNFKLDVLQKTLFQNQPVSTFKFQNKTEEFIKAHDAEIKAEIKKIETAIMAKGFDKNNETIIIHNPGHLKDSDTVVIDVANKKQTRRITTDSYRYLFGSKFKNNSDIKIKSVEIRNNKVYCLHIFNTTRFNVKHFYGLELTFYPNGITETDTEKFTAYAELQDFGSHYYLRYCKTRYHNYKNQYIFKVQGHCFG